MDTSASQIDVTPGVAGGKPRIAGPNIAIWHERLGLSADEIATEYGLSLADIYAALAYYDHREEIDRSIREDEEFVAELRRHTPSLLRQAQGGVDPDVVEAASLAHDLGHPPFGHLAEEELHHLG